MLKKKTDFEHLSIGYSNLRDIGKFSDIVFAIIYQKLIPRSNK